MAIDVSIAIKVDSLVPYVAVDRAMSNPTDTIYFMNICASNSALASIGVKEDDNVAANFEPLNNKVALKNAILSIDIANGAVSSLGSPIVPGTVAVSIVKGGITYTGFDYAKDGKIFFRGLSDIITVSYFEGTFEGLPTDAETGSIATAQADSQRDTQGATILKVKPAWVNVQLTTTPHQIILEENAQVAAYMQKISQNTSRVASTSDYTTMQFDKVVKTYKNQVNVELINLIVTATNLEIADPTNSAEAVTVDLSDYSVYASRNETRDDLVNGMIIDMKAAFLAKTTMEPTVIITGSKGAAELARNAVKWVRAPGFGNQLDGLAGTFDGTPVFRHHLLDELDRDDATINAAAGDVTFYMAAKLPDNSSGSLAFGEFISLIKTPTAQNYNNPFQLSSGMYSQIGSKVIQPNLFQKGIIKKSK